MPLSLSRRGAGNSMNLLIFRSPPRDILPCPEKEQTEKEYPLMKMWHRPATLSAHAPEQLGSSSYALHVPTCAKKKC